MVAKKSHDKMMEHLATVSENPAVHYNNPDEIVADTNLSDLDRHRLLEEWQTDIAQKMSADEDGMPPAPGPQRGKDIVTLEKIANAQTAVDEEAE